MKRISCSFLHMTRLLKEQDQLWRLYAKAYPTRRCYNDIEVTIELVNSGQGKIGGSFMVSNTSTDFIPALLLFGKDEFHCFSTYSQRQQACFFHWPPCFQKIKATMGQEGQLDFPWRCTGRRLWEFTVYGNNAWLCPRTMIPGIQWWDQLPTTLAQWASALSQIIGINNH